MTAPRGPHHSGSFNRRSRQLNAAAAANPHTICWRDGLTLAQHPPHKTGQRPWWTTGHLTEQDHGVIDREATVRNIVIAQQHGAHIHTIDGLPCAHEASTCNYVDGATRGNRARVEPHSTW